MFQHFEKSTFNPQTKSTENEVIFWSSHNYWCIDDHFVLSSLQHVELVTVKLSMKSFVCTCSWNYRIYIRWPLLLIHMSCGIVSVYFVYSACLSPLCSVCRWWAQMASRCCYQLWRVCNSSRRWRCGPFSSHCHPPLSLADLPSKTIHYIQILYQRHTNHLPTRHLSAVAAAFNSSA